MDSSHISDAPAPTPHISDFRLELERMAAATTDDPKLREFCLSIAKKLEKPDNPYGALRALGAGTPAHVFYPTRESFVSGWKLGKEALRVEIGARRPDDSPGDVKLHVVLRPDREYLLGLLRSRGPNAFEATLREIPRVSQAIALDDTTGLYDTEFVDGAVALVKQLHPEHGSHYSIMIAERLDRPSWGGVVAVGHNGEMYIEAVVGIPSQLNSGTQTPDVTVLRSDINTRRLVFTPRRTPKAFQFDLSHLERSIFGSPEALSQQFGAVIDAIPVEEQTNNPFPGVYEFFVVRRVLSDGAVADTPIFTDRSTGSAFGFPHWIVQGENQRGRYTLDV